MASDTDGTTIGIWYGADESIIDNFDDHFGADPGYSRSRRIKDAMGLAIAIDEVLESIDHDGDIAERRTHALVKSAIRNELGREE